MHFVTSFGRYIKVGQGSEEQPAFDKHLEQSIMVLPGMHSFSAQQGGSPYPWGKWHPKLQRIPLTDRHRMLQLERSLLVGPAAGFSLMAWIQRRIGGRGFALRKVLRSTAPLSPESVFARQETVEQCWAWYMDAVPALHFGDQARCLSGHSHAECHSTPTACRWKHPNLTERAAQNYSLPRYGASAWTDGKLHLEAVVVTATHVRMYQDLKLVRSQTHAEAFDVPADAQGPHFPGTCLTSGCERMILRDHCGCVYICCLCKQLCSTAAH